LQVWVHGRQYPELTGDYWDDNWLRVTIQFHNNNSDFILKNEPAIHLGDLYQLHFECEELKEGKKESVEVEFTEPYLQFKFDFKPKRAEFRLILEIPTVEKHEYTLAVSKNDLKLLLTQLDNVFTTCPLIGNLKIFGTDGAGD